MPQIPQTTRRVNPADRINQPMVDPRVASLPWEELAKIGGQVTEMGADYLDRRRKLEQTSREADYRNRVQHFKTTLAEKKGKAIREQGMSYEDMPSLVREESERFSKELQANGLSEYSSDWQFTSEGLFRSEVTTVEKTRITDLVDRNKRAYSLAMQEGDTEGADRFLGAIVGAAGQAEGANVVSGYEYKSLNSSIKVNDINYSRGLIDTQQYMENLEEIARKADESEYMDVGQKGVISGTAMAGVVHAQEKVAKDMSKATKEYKKLAMDGELTSELFEGVISNYGEHIREPLIQSMRTGLSQAVITDDNARQAGEVIKNLLESDNPQYIKALEDMSKIEGYSQFGTILLLDVMDDTLSEESSSQKYNTWFFGADGEVKITGNPKKYLETTIEFMQDMPEGQDAFLKKKLKSYAKWTGMSEAKKKEAGLVTIDDLIDKDFRDDTFDKVSRAIRTGAQGMMSFDAFRADFLDQEGREPTEEEIDMLKGRAWL